MPDTWNIITLAATFILALVGFLLNKKLEGMKSSLSKNEFIHKLQFEKEFDIYNYLWMKIAHFKEAAKKYFDILPINEEKSEFYDPLLKEWEEVKETISIREPFIAKEVYEQTNKLIEISLEPLAKFKNPINADQDELVKIRDEIFEICEGIGKAIRKRIIV